jgi:hypothetical protein
MPIVSRYKDVQPRADGSVLAVIGAVDSLGRDWNCTRARYADAAAAQTACDAYDWGPQLENVEEQQNYDAICGGTDPDTISQVDLTFAKFRNRILKRFRRTRIYEGDEAKCFLCGVADFVANVAKPQIAQALGITNPEAQRIIDRAVRLRDFTCPDLDADDLDVVPE